MLRPPPRSTLFPYTTLFRSRIFDSNPRFIGEFAEIHFPRVRGKSQHVDVGPGAKNAILRAGQDHGVDLWVFEPDALQGDRKSTRLNSSHTVISYAVFCLKKK